MKLLKPNGEFRLLHRCSNVPRNRFPLPLLAFSRLQTHRRRLCTSGVVVIWYSTCVLLTSVAIAAVVLRFSWIWLGENLWLLSATVYGVRKCGLLGLIVLLECSSVIPEKWMFSRRCGRLVPPESAVPTSLLQFSLPLLARVRTLEAGCYRLARWIYNLLLVLNVSSRLLARVSCRRQVVRVVFLSPVLSWWAEVGTWMRCLL